jgi:hypothetical protein
MTAGSTPNAAFFLFRPKRDDNELGPQLGEGNFPEIGLVEIPKLDTRALSPAGMLGGKATLRLAA